MFKHKEVLPNSEAYSVKEILTEKFCEQKIDIFLSFPENLKTTFICKKKTREFECVFQTQIGFYRN